MRHDEALAAHENGVAFSVGPHFGDLLAERGELHVYPGDADDFTMGENGNRETRHQDMPGLGVDVGLDDTLLLPLRGDEVIIKLAIDPEIIVLEDRLAILAVGKGNIALARTIR